MKTVLRVVAFLIWQGVVAGHAAAQPAVAASVKFEVSHTPQGPFVQFVPHLGYDFSRWSVDAALPIEFVSASSTSTAQGATSHRGMGDGSLSLSYAIASDRVNFSSTARAAAPTGDSTVGLGAGQVTWDWTSHVDHLFGWVAPFIDAGVGDSLGSGNATATLAGAGGATRSRALPYTTVGKAAHGDAGVDLYVWGPLSWNLSGYDTIPWGDQTIISLFVPQTTKAGQPIGPKKLRAFEAAAQTPATASDAADHGLSTSLDVYPDSPFSLSVGFSRSVKLNLNVVSVSVGVNLAKLYRQTRPRP